MRLALVIIIKNTIIGKFIPLNAAEKEKPWNRFRYWLMSKVNIQGEKEKRRKREKRRERERKGEREREKEKIGRAHV